MPSTVGSTTKTIFLHQQSHKLSIEFTVKAGTSVKAGMPVELHTDGTVAPVTTATAATTGIGIALTDRAAGEKVTVLTRGFVTVQAWAKTPMNAGPVIWDSYDGTNLVNLYDDTAVTATNIAGWALNAAASANDPITVLIKD